MNSQNFDSKRKKSEPAQTTPLGESGFDMTSENLHNAGTRFENDEKILNQNIEQQNHNLRRNFGAVAATVPLCILVFVGLVIWCEPEKIKSMGDFGGSAFVAAPLLTFLTIYGLLIQGIFNARGETVGKIYPDATTSKNPMNSKPDSTKHEEPERSLEIKFENFVRDRVGKADIARLYVREKIPELSHIIKTSVYDINSISELKGIKEALQLGKYGQFGDLWDLNVTENSTVAVLEQFIQFRQHEHIVREQRKLDKKAQNQQIRKQNYRLRRAISILGTIAPIVIILFLGAVVWCKPDTFEKMGSYAGAAFVSATLLSFVVVYGFLVRGIFNGRKRDDKYTVEELWDLIKRNLSIALND